MDPTVPIGIGVGVGNNVAHAFGHWLFPATVLVIAVAMLEYYDSRWAYALAAITLLSLFLHYPKELNGFLASIGVK